MPSREAVLAITKLEDAFDLSTRKAQASELALVRAASDEGLVFFTEHAVDEADDEGIPQEGVWRVVDIGRATRKDLEPSSSDGPPAGINFEGRIADGRRIRVKVGWDCGYFIATVHTI